MEASIILDEKPFFFSVTWAIGGKFWLEGCLKNTLIKSSIEIFYKKIQRGFVEIAYSAPYMYFFGPPRSFHGSSFFWRLPAVSLRGFQPKAFFIGKHNRSKINITHFIGITQSAFYLLFIQSGDWDDFEVGKMVDFQSSTNSKLRNRFSCVF